MAKDKQISKQLSNLNESESKELIKSLINSVLSEGESEHLTIKEKMQRLKECKDAINSKNTFKVGDIVKWKPHLKNRTMPEYGDPLIVLELLEKPLFDKDEGPDSPYFNEPLDIVLGLIADEGEFISFYYDRRRVEPFNKK